MQQSKELSFWDKYSFEIGQIYDMLEKMEDGKVMEISGKSSDGKLSTNIFYLRDGIEYLLNSIANGKPGATELIQMISYKRKI